MSVTLRPCPHCGKANRIPLSRLGQNAKCGSCRVALPPTAEPIDVGPSEFDEIVTGVELPILVDFWAAWCGPCRQASAEVKRAATELAGRALVLKVDTERHPQLAQRFGVRGIPNFVIVHRGRTVFSQAGLVSYRELCRWVDSVR